MTRSYRTCIIKRALEASSSTSSSTQAQALAGRHKNFCSTLKHFTCHYLCYDITCTHVLPHALLIKITNAEFLLVHFFLISVWDTPTTASNFEFDLIDVYQRFIAYISMLCRTNNEIIMVECLEFPCFLVYTTNFFFLHI